MTKRLKASTQFLGSQRLFDLRDHALARVSGSNRSPIYRVELHGGACCAPGAQLRLGHWRIGAC